MRAMVTGGAGFIGSHIVDELISLGHEVCVVDDLSHGKKKNINPGAKFYKLDIRDEKLDHVFEEHKPDVVFHEAAQISVNNSIINPMKDASINIMGTLNLLDCCRRWEVKKVVYPASAASIGEPQYLPVDEEHPLNMMSGYGVTKHAVEHYLDVYWKCYGIKYTVLRYANVYGPRQDSSGEGGVVAIFSERLLRGQKPHIYGDGKQTRDFVYVKDVVKANLMAIHGLENDVFNVCSGEPVSVNGLFRMLKQLSGSSVECVYTEAREGDIRDSYMTCHKINEWCGWKPDFSLKEGLGETLAYYRSAAYKDVMLLDLQTTGFKL